MEIFKSIRAGNTDYRYTRQNTQRMVYNIQTSFICKHILVKGTRIEKQQPRTDTISNKPKTNSNNVLTRSMTLFYCGCSHGLLTIKILMTYPQASNTLIGTH